MDKDILRKLLDHTITLEESMKETFKTTSQENLYRFANYKFFMRKYNEIALRVVREIGSDVVFDVFDVEKVKDWGDTLFATQKNYFEITLTNVALLRSTIERKLDIKDEGTLNLKNFLSANLRRAVLHEVSDEYYIQDVIEQLLIGKEFSKGIDYDREVGRVKVSIKEVKPDFVFPKLDLALEVKLSKTHNKSKEIVDEINSDIQSYSKKYSRLMFLIYDLGTIRDENEFKNDLDNGDNIQVLIVKH